MNDVKAEFESAVEVARGALARFREEPMVPSERGGPRLSPWFRVWRDASEVAQRWHRRLEQSRPEPNLDEEIDRLLDEAQG